MRLNHPMMQMDDNERQPVTEDRLREIEAAGGLGHLTNSLENAIVLDLVAEIRRLQGRE